MDEFLGQPVSRSFCVYYFDILTEKVNKLDRLESCLDEFDSWGAESYYTKYYTNAAYLLEPKYLPLLKSLLERDHREAIGDLKHFCPLSPVWEIDPKSFDFYRPRTPLEEATAADVLRECKRWLIHYHSLPMSPIFSENTVTKKRLTRDPDHMNKVFDVIEKPVNTKLIISRTNSVDSLSDVDSDDSWDDPFVLNVTQFEAL